MWLTVAALLESIFGRRRSRLVCAVLIGGVLIAKILIISKIVTLAEVAGATTAYGVWLATLGLHPRARTLFAVIALFVFILLWRLEPFTFVAPARGFGWIPLLSFLNGSTDVDVESFLEKVFYYGSLIWLIAASGVQLWKSAVLVALLLLTTSGLEIYLPQRSAETSYAIIALIIGGLIALTNGRTVRRRSPQCERPEALASVVQYSALTASPGASSSAAKSR